MAEQAKDVFQQLKDGLIACDVVNWGSKYLMLEGKPFSLVGNGYKPFCDIYRYITTKALEKDSKKEIILNKSRQVGATIMSCVCSLFMLCNGQHGFNGKPPIRILHLFPHQVASLKYSKTKFSAMMSSAISFDGEKRKPGQKSFIEQKIDKSTPSNDSISFKQFEGGNHIFIEYTGTNGERLKGLSADIVFFDEMASYLNANITLANISKSLTKSPYNVRIYFGTPLNKGSDYHKMWNASSQQYYHLGCEKCKEHFPLYTPGSDEWENIWLHGFMVKCTKCSHIQDKRFAAERGKWIMSNDDPTLPYVGYFINQLFMPEMTKEKILSEKHGIHPVNSERTYRNEVLGEFFSGDSSPITLEDINLCCADRDRKMRAVILPGENKRAYLGIDFGSKDNIFNYSDNKNSNTKIADKIAGGQSYSCVTVIVPEGNILNVVYAKRLEKNTFEYKKSVIEQLYRQFPIVQGVGDIGYAKEIGETLQLQFGERYLTSTSSGKLLNKFKYLSDIFPKTIMFDKDYLLDEMYTLMKNGRIKLPFGNYEHIQWLVNHLCFGLEIKTVISKLGEQSERYVKSSAPSDGAFALANAILAHKFDITRGFTINETMSGSSGFGNSTIKKPNIVLAYAPRRR